MISTHSKFYYGYTVTPENQAIDLREDGVELAATLDVGSYSLMEFVAEILRAIGEVSAKSYDVTVDRATRKITIACVDAFDLLVNSGLRAGSGAWTLMGFTGSVDLTGLVGYTSDSATGKEYKTQFKLQSYTSSEDFRGVVDDSVNKSASGVIELISFGEERFVEFNMRYVTSRALGANSVVRENLTGVEDLRSFLRYLITKGPFEFIPDESDPSTFEKLLLESTATENKGTAYKLKELYDVGLPGFYETGNLKCRVIL